jgi:hypothetical protein
MLNKPLIPTHPRENKKTFCILGRWRKDCKQLALFQGRFLLGDFVTLGPMGTYPSCPS